MSKHDLRLPETDSFTYISQLSGLVPDKLPPKPTATRTVVNHMAPCWSCSKHLQACTNEGKPIGKPGLSPSYKGCSLAFIAVIDGYPRRLHRRCAERLGFRISLYTIEAI